MSKWNNFDSHIRNLPTISKFKSVLLEFLRPKSYPTFKLGKKYDTSLLARLRVGFTRVGF